MPYAHPVRWGMPPSRLHPPTVPPGPDGVLGLTRALYSNWLYWRPLRLLVDAGPGVSVGLGRFAGSPRVLALTHGHDDHLLGVPELLGARRPGSMTSGGPLTVLTPRGCPRVAILREYLARMWPEGLDTDVSWLEVSPGDRVPLDAHRTIAVFQTRHHRVLPTVGYAVVEARSRLRSAYAGRPGPEVAEAVRTLGRSAVQETCEHTLWAHTGDTMPLDEPLLTGADTVVVDATFLSAADRDGPTHASVEEAVGMLARHAVGHGILHHLSMRYERPELAQAVEAVLRQMSAQDRGRTRLTLWDDTTFTPLAG